MLLRCPYAPNIQQVTNCSVRNVYIVLLHFIYVELSLISHLVLPVVLCLLLCFFCVLFRLCVGRINLILFDLIVNHLK